MKKVLQEHRICLFLIKALVLYLGFCTQAMAQQIIQGKVTDENNMPLFGVDVSVKGTIKGANTDTDGKYSIETKTNSTLVFSYMGYITKEVVITNQKTVNISIMPDTKVLDEVVVSYGSQVKKKILSSVVVLKADDLQDLPAAEIGQKLQGRVAGLQVNQVTGRPGQGMAFRIRGAASLGSGNQPLIVVDGQPISGGINLLNPDDIESFSVLKDASSLYGSRASNGVILITTKQAKVGAAKVSFNTYYGVQTVLERGRPDMMNANEFATYMKGFYEDKIRYENYKYPKTGLAEVPDDYKNPEQYGAGTNWYNSLLRSAPIQNYSLNISTGTNKVLSSNSLTYFNQEGVLQNSGMSRISFRSNNEYRPNESVKFGFNVAPTYQKDNNTGGPFDGNRNVLGVAVLSSPLIPVQNPDGSFPLPVSYNMYAMPNAYEQLQIMQVSLNSARVLGNVFIELKVIDGLKFKTTLSTDLGSSENNYFRPSNYGTAGKPIGNLASSIGISNHYTSWMTESLLTYNKSIKDHNFNFIGGYSAQKYEMNTYRVNGTGFANDLIPWSIAASTITGYSTNTANSIISAFSRLNYDYKGKYLFSASIREDGSSRFGMDKKFGVFPSISAGWIASEEPFFPKSENLSLLKVKASYGITGNNNIGDYTQTSLITPTNYVFSGTSVPGLSTSTLGNSELTWETSKQLDLGLEATILNDRVTLSYDYYNKRTSGMLFQVSLPYASGYSSLKYNIGEFKMWGHEMQISSVNLKGNLKWNSDFNLSFNDNVVLALQDNTPIGGINKYNDFNRTAVGHRIGELYGYVFDGVYMNQAEFDSQPKEVTSVVGSARMKDINGDGKINGDDRTFLGNSSPKFQYGLTNEFQYKKFDLSISVSGQGGNKIMNSNLQNLQNLDGIWNVEKNMANRWRSPENPGNGQVPSTRSGSTELYRSGNSNWVFSGDFLAIRNISAGYTLDFKQKFFKTARIYISANQVYVFTKYPGQNPEVNDSRDTQTTAGIDNGSYPIPRTISLGANINF
jgi:TonB-linked SusC/RagA family outer membrane protein